MEHESRAATPRVPPEAVWHALFLIAHRNLLTTGPAQLLLVSATCWLSRTQVSAGTLWQWWAFMAVVSLSYLAIYAGFRRYAATEQTPAVVLRRWRWCRSAAQIASAAGWGYLGAFLVPDDSVHNIIVMTVLTGTLGHSAAANTANDWRSYIVSAVLLSTVLFSLMPAALGADAWALNALFVFYLAALLSVVRNAQRAMRETIRLRLSNEQLARQNALHAQSAERANRQKSEFLAAASHDLRQPVHALMLLLQAYRQAHPQSEGDPVMRQIGQAADSISELFGALMELSRLEGGQERCHPQWLGLAESVAAAVDKARPFAQAKDLRCEVRVSQRLRGARVYLDKVLWERVLGNLISNAVRYTQSGRIVALVRARAGGGAVVHIADTGVGIAPADMERVFEPYVQLANSERDRSKGLGLGLAIVQRCVSLLTLRLQARSRPGAGSCFSLELPASLLVGGGTEAARPGPELSEYTLPALRHCRVLMVDDDALVREATRAHLTLWGCDTRCVASRDAAMAELHAPGAWQPDCVLSDFRLCGPWDGIEVLDQLLELCPRSAGILITGDSGADMRARADEAGYLLLSKPVDARVLGAALERIYQNRRGG